MKPRIFFIFYLFVIVVAALYAGWLKKAAARQEKALYNDIFWLHWHRTILEQRYNRLVREYEKASLQPLPPDKTEQNTISDPKPADMLAQALCDKISTSQTIEAFQKKLDGLPPAPHGSPTLSERFLPVLALDSCRFHVGQSISGTLRFARHCAISRNVQFQINRHPIIADSTTGIASARLRAGSDPIATDIKVKNRLTQEIKTYSKNFMKGTCDPEQ